MASFLHPKELHKYHQLPYHLSTSSKSRSISPRLLSAFLFIGLLLFIPTYFTFKYSFSSPLPNSPQHQLKPNQPKSSSFHVHHQDPSTTLTELIPDQSIVKGGAIMPKMGNATAKAELGRATWKFMHTMTARFPEKPTDDQREALKSFIYLFSRLYPCGDCARHFQELLKQYPPQTSSRNAASLHLCSLHNLVNKRLGKAEYNCTTLAENYDCGCAHDDEPGSPVPSAASSSSSSPSKTIQDSNGIELPF